jgi:uncharacterized protein (DUF2336 family)
MSSHQSVIEELEETLSNRSIGYRADALRRVTDLFLSAAAECSDRETSVFDDVMTRLSEEIEVSIRAELARQLAKIPNAPPKLIRRLAADRSIEVAGPVLRDSDRLDDESLVANAMTASQDHLLAISQRAAISEVVTDILVERGDRAVALSTVDNVGARLSGRSHDILVKRCKDDDALAVGVWSRRDIPRHHLLRLFTVASENTRRALETVDSHRVNLIRDMVVDVSNQFQARMRAQSRDYAEARRIVCALHQAGQLEGAKIREFATTGEFDQVTVALSILCDLPIGACERAMVQNRADLLLLLAKAIGLSWDTTKAILLLRAGPGGLPMQEREETQDSFTKLRSETARKALHFLRLRERASICKAERSPGIDGA